MFVFLFLLISNTVFVILIVKANTRVKLALIIPEGTPTKLVREIEHPPPLVPDKTIKVLSKQSKAETYLLSLLPIIFLS